MVSFPALQRSVIIFAYRMKGECALKHVVCTNEAIKVTVGGERGLWETVLTMTGVIIMMFWTLVLPAHRKICWIKSEGHDMRMMDCACTRYENALYNKTDWAYNHLVIFMNMSCPITQAQGWPSMYTRYNLINTKYIYKLTLVVYCTSMTSFK